jgi:hypothetical protein
MLIIPFAYMPLPVAGKSAGAPDCARQPPRPPSRSLAIGLAAFSTVFKGWEMYSSGSTGTGGGAAGACQEQVRNPLPRIDVPVT